MKQPSALFLPSLARLPLGIRLAAGVVAVAMTSAVAYFGATLYPDYSIPRGPKAEQRIAKVFGMPSDADAHLVGDIVIERFYAVEPVSGRRYVADMCKGRVSQVIEVEKEDGTVTYSVLLDRRDLQVDKLSSLIDDAAPPASDVTYLGVKLQGGNSDVFQVNYGGRLARNRADFRGPHGEDTYTFLSKFKSTNIGPALLTNKDNNFILNSTGNFPYFAGLFQLKDAVLLSHLVFLDATSESSVQTGTQ
jgi:hypothetical protein